MAITGSIYHLPTSISTKSSEKLIIYIKITDAKTKQICWYAMLFEFQNN